MYRMTTLHFQVLTPPPQLSRIIECIRVTTYSGDQPLNIKVCPSGYPGIVFQLAADKLAAIERISIRSEETSHIPILFLHGQGSEPSIMNFRAMPYTTIQIVLKPHALHRIFGWDANLYNQGLLNPEQFDAVELERVLQTMDSNEQRIARLHLFLQDRLTQTNKSDVLIEQMLDYIREHITTISVRELVAVFHISERQLQKRFSRVIGITPQLFIRIRRVNEALRMMHSGRYDRLSDVAYALNYYDQSHFIRDMKAFSWVSPKHIATNVREFHSDLAGSSYL